MVVSDDFFFNIFREKPKARLLLKPRGGGGGGFWEIPDKRLQHREDFASTKVKEGLTELLKQNST